jgi:hypothetical protein
MGALMEGRSIEAEIADCCQAIYRATDLEVAMSNWARLRQLMVEKTELEISQFMRETASREPRNERSQSPK